MFLLMSPRVLPAGSSVIQRDLVVAPPSPDNARSSPADLEHQVDICFAANTTAPGPWDIYIEILQKISALPAFYKHRGYYEARLMELGGPGNKNSEAVCSVYQLFNKERSIGSDS